MVCPLFCSVAKQSKENIRALTTTIWLRMWWGLSQHGWHGRPQVHTLSPQPWSCDDLEPPRPMPEIHETLETTIPVYPGHIEAGPQRKGRVSMQTISYVWSVSSSLPHLSGPGASPGRGSAALRLQLKGLTPHPTFSPPDLYHWWAPPPEGSCRMCLTAPRALRQWRGS